MTTLSGAAIPQRGPYAKGAAGWVGQGLPGRRMEHYETLCNTVQGVFSSRGLPCGRISGMLGS